MSPEELKALTVFPERDLIGYGPDRPDPKWPNGAKIAVNFVIVRLLRSLQLLVLIRIQNYEEGAASAIDLLGELTNGHQEPRTRLRMATRDRKLCCKRLVL